MTAARFATLVLRGVSALGAAATIYCLVHGGHPNVRTCAVPAALLALLAFFASRLDESRRIGMALATLATLATLWAIDIALALNPPARSLAEQTRRAARAAGINLDTTAMLNVVRGLRRTSPDVYPTIYMGNHWETSRFFTDSLYPLGGISGVTSVMCNEGTWITYRADEHGLANPPGAWARPTLDVVALGDSYTMGWCVPPESSFVARIRGRYPAMLVLGFGASGPLTQLGQLREFLPARRPRMVLWFYYERNDLNDLDTEKNQPLLQRYLVPGFSQELERRQAYVDEHLRSFSDERERQAARRAEESARRPPPAARGLLPTLFDVARLTHLRDRFTPPPPAAAPSCCDLRLYRRVVEQARDAVRGWGGELMLVYLPSDQRLSRRGPMGRGEQAGDSVVALWHSLDVPVLDLRVALREAGPARELSAYAGSHYSERGHQAVADLVIRALAQRPGIVPAP